MNNKIKKILVDEVVKPLLNERAYASTGYVKGYERHTRKLDIQYKNPNDGSKAIANNIPMAKNPPGFHEVEPKPGDRVLIIFESGNVEQPRVAAVFDENYSSPWGPWDELYSKKGASMPKTLNKM